MAKKKLKAVASSKGFDSASTVAAAQNRFITVKVRISTRTRLQDLLSLISQGGWSAVADERREPPTLSSIVDAAIEAYWSRRT